MYLKAKVVVCVVAIVDDGGIESMSIVDNDVMSLSGDHWRLSLGCRIEVVKQVIHHI